MNESEWLAEQFERNRSHLRAVAYRMLGSSSEADDAVQECWMRLDRSGADDVGNLRGWLTTVVGRVCLDMLRSRRSRREETLGTPLVAPIVTVEHLPADEAELADSVGLALLVVLESLTPAERLAFVLHDMFAVPFEEIAPAIDRTPAAARQLASRARRRVRGAAPRAEGNLRHQLDIAAAFLAASREGDFEALVALLAPDAVFRIDLGRLAPARPSVAGASAVAREVLSRGTAFAPHGRPAIVEGSAGAVVVIDGNLRSVVSFTVSGERIVAIDVIADPEKLRRVKLDA